MTSRTSNYSGEDLTRCADLIVSFWQQYSTLVLVLFIYSFLFPTIFFKKYCYFSLHLGLHIVCMWLPFLRQLLWLHSLLFIRIPNVPHRFAMIRDLWFRAQSYLLCIRLLINFPYFFICHINTLQENTGIDNIVLVSNLEKSKGNNLFMCSLHNVFKHKKTSFTFVSIKFYFVVGIFF